MRKYFCLIFAAVSMVIAGCGGIDSPSHDDSQVTRTEIVKEIL